jgi:hypothetical protein
MGENYVMHTIRIDTHPEKKEIFIDNADKSKKLGAFVYPHFGRVKVDVYLEDSGFQIVADGSSFNSEKLVAWAESVRNEAVVMERRIYESSKS